MKCSEFRRWLQAQGAEFQAAKGSDFKVDLNGTATIYADDGQQGDARRFTQNDHRISRRPSTDRSSAAPATDEWLMYQYPLTQHQEQTGDWLSCQNSAAK
ncbi:hypothetical protein [Pseudomonas amygdali]|uniref:hypothetical protein n=1 Tax=Pseudomonas amygdali TaxID=47877 RepID=UPI0035324EE7